MFYFTAFDMTRAMVWQGARDFRSGPRRGRALVLFMLGLVLVPFGALETLVRGQRLF